MKVKFYRCASFELIYISRSLEVESLITEAAQTVIIEEPSWLPHRDVIIGKLIKALEADASWVDLFGVTGELNVPGKDENEPAEPLQRAKEVCQFYYLIGWCSFPRLGLAYE